MLDMMSCEALCVHALAPRRTLPPTTTPTQADMLAILDLELLEIGSK